MQGSSDHAGDSFRWSRTAVDAQQARVRVPLTRLSSSDKVLIRKQIQQLDRNIATCNGGICQAEANVQIHAGILKTAWGEYWKTILSDRLAARRKLDRQRKQLRLKLKGY